MDGERRLLWKVILTAVQDWSAPPSVPDSFTELMRTDATAFLFDEDGGLEEFAMVLGVSASGLRERLIKKGPDTCRELIAAYRLECKNGVSAV